MNWQQAHQRWRYHSNLCWKSGDGEIVKPSPVNLIPPDPRTPKQKYHAKMRHLWATTGALEHKRLPNDPEEADKVLMEEAIAEGRWKYL